MLPSGPRRGSMQKSGIPAQQMQRMDTRERSCGSGTGQIPLAEHATRPATSQHRVGRQRRGSDTRQCTLLASSERRVPAPHLTLVCAACSPGVLTTWCQAAAKHSTARPRGKRRTKLQEVLLQHGVRSSWVAYHTTHCPRSHFFFEYYFNTPARRGPAIHHVHF